MKTIHTSLALAATLACSSATAFAANVAEVHMANESLLIHGGPCSCGFGLVFTMYFSTYYTDDPTRVNEQIAPLPQPAAYDYWTYLVLEDVSMTAAATYAELDLPTDDSNHNGIPDFFEVSQAISATTSGTYEVPWASGTGQLTLEWTRAAGSRTGTMLLTEHDPILGDLGPFTHTFELVRYTGQLTYTPGTNRLTGTLSLVKDGPVLESLSGPVTITKSATNRFNQLTLVAGDWTTSSGSFSFGDTELTRDPEYPSLYQGTLSYPNGAAQPWKLWITDTNDANGNGIPDFSDDLAVIVSPRSPVLSLSLTASNLLLRISGDVGRTNVVQQASALGTTNWSTIQTFVSTNDPQVVALPLPAMNPRYWRVQVR